MNAMGQEESACAEVIKLEAIVALNALNSDPNLCVDISKEIRKGGKGVRV